MDIAELIQKMKGNKMMELERSMREFPSQDPSRYSGHDKHLEKLGNENLHILQKIWGTNERNWILSSNTLQHLAVFIIPEIVEAAHAMAPNRYRNDTHIPIETGRTADSIAQAVGIVPYKDNQRSGVIPWYTRNQLNTWHLPGKDKRNWNPRLYNEKSPGIPHVAMGYSLYEMLRASEYLAEKDGNTLSKEDRELNFKYFSQILQRAGYHFPDSRAQMEEMARGMDKLARYTPMVAELTDRLFRTSQKKNHGAYDLQLENNLKADQPATLETIQDFLRPNSKEVFMQVADEYRFDEYETERVGVK